MVSDNLEFRFLNTDSIRSYLLTNCLVQGKKLYKNFNYIDTFEPISIADNPEKLPTNGETWIINGSEIPIESTRIDGDALSIYQETGYGGLQNAPDYKNTSPYSINLRGNWTNKIKALDIIRIKNAITEGINGQYHVLSVESNENNTIVYVIEKVNQSDNEGVLYFATYEQWRTGGPDNFATWNKKTSSWIFTEIKPGDIVTVQKPSYETYVYSENFKFVEYSLRLPLQMTLKIFVDKNAVNQYSVDLEEQRKTIKLEVAKYLQYYYTGTDINYYPSSIIEFVSNNRRFWIKGMYIITTDSSSPTPFEFRNGIEAFPEHTIRDNISSSKLEILKYTSAFYWWDVDNIKIEYELN